MWVDLFLCIRRQPPGEFLFPEVRTMTMGGEYDSMQVLANLRF